MLSRIADSLYWMNRYMERADGLLRIASVHYILGMDREAGGLTTWRPVLQLFTATTEKRLAVLESNTEESLRKLLIDSTNTNSLRTIVNKARENARGAQDYVTKEVWEEINGMYHLVNDSGMPERLKSYQAVDVLKELTRRTVLYAGTVDITMPRGNGWYFMSLGRYVERCLQTLALAEKQLERMEAEAADGADILQWRRLLFSLSGYELHLKTYSSSEVTENVLHQVLSNENFPRSVVYALRRINLYLERVAGAAPNNEGTALLRSYGRLYAKVRFMDLAHLTTVTVRPFLAEVKEELFAFNKQFERHFFSYA